jgi:hypothetical protein
MTGQELHHSHSLSHDATHGELDEANLRLMTVEPTSPAPGRRACRMASQVTTWFIIIVAGTVLRRPRP